MAGPQKNNLSLTNPVVLFAPLDWGLGHTTRCIPLIHYFLSLGCQVVAAVDEKQQAILEKEFTNLKFVSLKGYRLAYGRSGWQTLAKIILQVPRIVATIYQENRWLKKFVQSTPVHAVISDNRYGLFSKKLPCIFVTHQLAIQTPFGAPARWLVQKINYRFIQQFGACWVPDYKENANLAGKLSHPRQMPSVPVSYIGRLSRIAEPLPAGNPGSLLIVLSGPEPQRSIFEEIVFSQLDRLQVPAVLVRGLPKAENAPPLLSKYVVVHNYLSAPELAAEISRAETIVSRSGYSTVMDITGRGKKCIFVPTPGQPEQIYLADYLQQKQLCICFRQNHFSLEKALQLAKTGAFAPMDGLSSYIYKEELETFVSKLKKANGPIAGSVHSSVK
ncbi:MAG: glycosyl transferase family 28 [Williamsia sp.]|nr:glycosyl transferase family 28 [Williamsia sp.]